MSSDSAIQDHYSHGRLIEAITQGLTAMGKTLETATVDDLAAVDEFHIGGRRASEDFIDQLSLGPDHHVLEIGCGFGGPARFAGARYGCRVAGIDLTGEYVEAARVLTDWVGMNERLEFHHGNALEMPFEDASFDAAMMLHVGMNIPDKPGLCAEVARTLNPGGIFGIYDVMVTGAGELIFPVPWASAADQNAAATPDVYKAALEASGFEIVAERNRRDFAISFFQDMRARAAQADGPPPLGLHIAMGAAAPIKIANMIANIEAGRVAPVELIAKLR